jgi:3D-(3,5/4)-trihydroxycyclohexane-1,2-dione acylhydrolase (decyclizing)
MATGSANFNNLLKDTRHETLPDIDFAAHATSMGAVGLKAASIAELETQLAKAKANDRTTVVVIETDPLASTEAGGHWWDVAVPQVSARPEVEAARKTYDQKRQMQNIGD